MTVLDDHSATARGRKEGFLYGPIVDFVCLGGGSLPILALIALLPPEEYRAQLLFYVWTLSVFINHPHFINSYQIFYDGFRDKIAPGAPLRHKYLFSGVVVPVCMVLFFGWCLVTADATLMAQSAYLMLFLVGWHYTKQGYGILMVEAVLKRAFFSDFEKTVLRYNALAIWLASWIYVNQQLGMREFNGLEYFTLGIPGWIAQIAVVVSTLTSLLALGVLVRKGMRTRLPINGIVAYVTASYVWLILVGISVLAIMLVPAFHSLQYLAVVWRYQSNKLLTDEEGQSERVLGMLNISSATSAMVRFILFGTLMGIVAFFLLPYVLDRSISYREEIFGTTLFAFMVTIFINIHHYFLDNVMWRRENPDVKKHLFS